MSTSSVSTIELEWSTCIDPLNPEENELLRQLYGKKSSHHLHSSAMKSRSIGRIIIKEELHGGFSGARVLVVVPVDRAGRDQPERVVKLGPRVMLESERDNYNGFVEDYLPMGVAIQKRFAARGPIAAIEYVFVGGKRLDPVDNLIEYYERHSARQITRVLNDLVDYLGECWYRQGRHTKELLRKEYGLHLPEQVTVMLRPKSDDRLWSGNEETPENMNGYRLLEEDVLLRDQNPAKPNDLVQIENLEVVRIKPWAATLEHQRERWGRVRVEYSPDSGIAQRLQIGQSVAVRGWVVTTRHSLLEAVVETAFRGHNEAQVSPNDDQVFPGLGRGPYPNPLKLYPALLDEMFEGNRSIIHGDLHPRNVLIDRHGQPWLIDFGRVRDGHTLFEFIKLEAYFRLDVLSRMSSFSLAEYVCFEESLASATFYGIHTATPPSKRDLLKAFRVILAIRYAAARFHGYGEHKDLVKTYFRCVLLYNLAMLKYSRRAVLGEAGYSGEKRRQLQAARLCFIAAAVQGSWLESPSPRRLSLRGILEWCKQLTAER